MEIRKRERESSGLVSLRKCCKERGMKKVPTLSNRARNCLVQV